jgi:hypothetical protein
MTGGAFAVFVLLLDITVAEQDWDDEEDIVWDEDLLEDSILIQSNTFVLGSSRAKLSVSAWQGWLGSEMISQALALVMTAAVLGMAAAMFRASAEPEDGPVKATKSVQISIKAEEARDPFAELLDAIHAGRSDACTRLLDLEPRLLRQQDAFGCQPVHVAARAGARECVELFLQRGASADASEAFNETPLHMAARQGHSAVCTSLMAAGACVDAQDLDGATPLLKAAQEGREEVCKILLEAGATTAGVKDAELPPLLTRLMVTRMFAGA